MIKTLPSIIAHRGASAFAPENTLPAFELAKLMEAPMIECDVQLSNDHVPVIIHDDTVDRTTYGTGLVPQFSFAALKDLKIKNNFDKSHYQFNTPLAIPSLVETLTWCINNNMKINLELKMNSTTLDAPLAKYVLQVIRPLPVALTELMIVSSFDWEQLAIFHELAPEFATGLLIDKDHWRDFGITGISQTVETLNALSLNIDVAILTPDIIKALKETAPYVLTYTVDNAKQAQELIDHGIDGVFSNNPLLLNPKQ